MTPAAVYLAWSYFGLRCAHSFIHLGSNNVTHRFAAFVASVIVLICLWCLLIASVAASAV